MKMASTFALPKRKKGLKSGGFEEKGEKGLKDFSSD
jgi:hypothetical protein